MNHTLASFVIRVKNEAALLQRCLEQIRAQVWDGEIEIVVIDSGSTDSTVAIARQFADQVIEIPPQDFDYSRTLNQAIEASRGSLVLPLSGHTVLKGTDWLQKMAAVFDDPRVAGVSCRQIAWPDADWTEQIRLPKDFPAGNRTWDGSDEGLRFSNAASALRRDLWRRHPFDQSAAEDIYWARWAVAEGYKVAYLADAEAYHSHNDTPRNRARRVSMIVIAHEEASGTFSGFFGSVRMTAGIVWRSAKLLVRMDAPVLRRLRYARQALAEAFWFLLIFRSLQKRSRAAREGTAGGPG